jgi:hypothetical protein
MSATSHDHGHGEPGADPESVAVGHELKDANISPLVLSAVGLAILLAVSFIFIAILMNLAGISVQQTGNTLPDNPISQLQVPPQPRLEQNPLLDSTKIVDDATKQIESYGWTDKQTGKAHIPVGRAMELVLERGVGGQ